MKISKQVAITLDRDLEESSIKNNEQVHIALSEFGFREISITEDSISAQRGSHFGTLFLSGDPRRIFHTMTISNQGIRFDLDTWFGVFAKADEEVFQAEGNQILDMLCGINTDGKLLRQATIVRRWSDVRMFLFLLAIGMALGLASFILTFVLSLIFVN